MRNYISIVVVALAAMFMATSCELESGTEPNPNRANQLLWNRVSDAVYQQHSHAEVVAQLNDTLIGKSYPKSVYQACELEVEDNIYTLTYNEGYYSRSYRIQTDGKLLNQGGVWVIYYRTGTYMEYVKMGTASFSLRSSSRQDAFGGCVTSPAPKKEETVVAVSSFFTV